MGPFENLTQDLSPLLRKPHGFTEFCSYFIRLLILLELVRGLEVENAAL